MVRLGFNVKDMITGLEGIAIGRTEWLYGCARIAVEPKGLKDGKPAETQWLDEQRVEETGGSDPAIPVKEPKSPGLQLGSHVRDSLTGFDGILVGETRWYTGETTITIEPDKLHDGKPIDAHGFNSNRVQLVEKKAPPVSPQSSARSGGPQKDPKRY